MGSMQPTSPASVWNRPETVANFVAADPNPVLMAWAERLAHRKGGPLDILDIGCGAGRNALPLTRLGHAVTGLDAAPNMLQAARERWLAESQAGGLTLISGSMEHLPFADGSFDVVIAHGVWNLAVSDCQLEQALAEARRVSRTEAGLFVFTFSRLTLPAEARPVPFQQHIFSDFSGSPQCFLTEAELRAKLENHGFVPEHPGPLTVYNLPEPGSSGRPRRPVLYEGCWLAR